MEENENVVELVSVEDSNEVEESSEDDFVSKAYVFNPDNLKVRVKVIEGTHWLVFITIDDHAMRYEVFMDNWELLEAQAELQKFYADNGLDPEDVDEDDDSTLPYLLPLVKAMLGQEFFKKSNQYFKRKGVPMSAAYVMDVVNKIQSAAPKA